MATILLPGHSLTPIEGLALQFGSLADSFTAAAAGEKYMFSSIASRFLSPPPC